MGKDVIIACDFASAEQVFAFLDKFSGTRVSYSPSKRIRRRKAKSFGKRNRSPFG